MWLYLSYVFIIIVMRKMLSKWLTRLLRKLGRKVERMFPKRLWKDVRGALANRVAGVICAMFILGALGATAVTMLSNSSEYGAGVPTTVKTIFTVALPIMIAVSLMLYFLPKRS